ncbi:MAG: 2OG-Fe(II) oxygenase [Dongiaceae bacterium]
MKTTSPATRREAPAGRAEIGDIAPPFALPSDDGTTVDPTADHIAGRFLLLVFLPDPERRGAFDAVLAEAAALAAAGTWTYVLAGAPAAGLAALKQRLGSPFPLVADADRAIARAYGCAAGGAVLLRPNQHVLARFAADGAGIVAGTLSAVAAARAARASPLCHPPILVVPDAFSRADCQRLISIYTMTGHRFVEPGHNVRDMTSDYKMRIPDYGRKDRIDHWLIAAEPNQLVDSRLQARVFPEVRKAFQYNITRRERYRIGCYEGERGGEAHGHRDNTAAIVAHRRFACSINLNTEEFEGGGLRFPEFGDQIYRPETGAAIVFSSSVLHEAMHVTAGRRFVLLSFIYGDV